MAEQKRRAESQDEKARPQELQQEAAGLEPERQGLLTGSGGAPLGPPDDISIQAVAARLGDTRFQIAQRQAMASRVRSLAGNAVLQRMIVQAQGGTPAPAGGGGQPTGEAVTAQQVKNRDDAKTNVRQLERGFFIKFEKWERAVRTVGSAYETAGTEHTNALKERTKAIALEEAIIFGILTAATGGAISAISTVAQGSSKDVLYNVLEDVVQSGLGEGIDVAQQAVAPVSAPVSKGYLGFQNSWMIKLSLERQKVLEYFKNVIDDIQSKPMSSWDNFDSGSQKARYQQGLSQFKLNEIPELEGKKEAIAKSLEKDMWAKWAPRLEHSVSLAGNPGEPTMTVTGYYKPKKAVESRLYYVGAFPKDYFGWYTFDSEIKEIVAWAQGHKPKKILDL